MSAGVTGQGTPSAGYHFPNGVLKCDSQCMSVCVCVCVCAGAHTHGCLTSGCLGEDRQSFLPHFPIFVSHGLSTLSDSFSLASFSFFLNICSLSCSFPAPPSLPHFPFPSLSPADLFHEHLPRSIVSFYRSRE